MPEMPVPALDLTQDMKRGNGANCTASGADVSQFLAKAKARAALVKGLVPTPKEAPAPPSVSAKSTLGMALFRRNHGSHKPLEL